MGNGASLSAVKNGKCVDTSMGLTPLEGVIMGTRSGDIDPAFVEYLCNKENLTVSEVLNILNKKSGMLGRPASPAITVMYLQQQKQAIRMPSTVWKHTLTVLTSHRFLHRSYGRRRCDHLTAGLGENAIPLRETICKAFEFMGLNSILRQITAVARRRSSPKKAPRLQHA